MHKAILISDFNLSNFASYLTNDEELQKNEVTFAPFGQVMQVLIQNNLDCWRIDYDFAVVWTRPEAVIESFARLLMYEKVSIDEITREVDEYAAGIFKIVDRVKTIFVPAWVMPTYQRGFGILDMKDGSGITNTLLRMNLRLCDHFNKSSQVHLLNTQKWIENAGKNSFNPKLWYMGKIAFGNEVFREAVSDIKASLQAVQGNSCKLIILDLDDTLWGGIIGDLGWKNIILGGHNALGEAYVDFQHALKSFTNRGILLGIASKNEESVVLEAIKSHPEMVLKLEDFAGYRINWQDKAQNIVDLVSDLQLGLQSVVFIDDNPFERGRVKESLPQVFVPPWPEHPMLYKSALLNLRCFDTISITIEDLERSKMYLQEMNRKVFKNKVDSIDDWIKGLNIHIVIEELNETNLARTAQLLNKTNQMNLSTRRLSEIELLNWSRKENRKVFVIKVSDKFGDYGLTGMASMEIDNSTGKIIDFILSCRVMGRKVEETMIYTLTKYASSLSVKKIYAQYIPTEKNKPCLDFWKKSQFSFDKKNVFIWEGDKDYALPEGIQIEGRER